MSTGRFARSAARERAVVRRRRGCRATLRGLEFDRRRRRCPSSAAGLWLGFRLGLGLGAGRARPARATGSGSRRALRLGRRRSRAPARSRCPPRSASQPKRRARKPRLCAATVIGPKAGGGLGSGSGLGRAGGPSPGVGLGFRLRLGLGLGAGSGSASGSGCGRGDVHRDVTCGPPAGGLDLDAAARAIALPDDLGLGLEPRDADLAELAKVAGQRRRVAELRPQLGRRLHERPLACTWGIGGTIRPAAAAVLRMQAIFQPGLTSIR